MMWRTQWLTEFTCLVIDRAVFTIERSDVPALIGVLLESTDIKIMTDLVSLQLCIFETKNAAEISCLLYFEKEKNKTNRIKLLITFLRPWKSFSGVHHWQNCLLSWYCVEQEVCHAPAKILILLHVVVLSNSCDRESF